MASVRSSLQSRQWRRDDYLITTDSSLIPLARLIDIFNSKEFYWANAMPLDYMKATLENSLCFGLFRRHDDDDDDAAGDAFLGLARCITDYTTFLYVTDVWVDPAVQGRGRGLGSWVVRCVQEVAEEMPYLRRSVLFTSSWEKSVPFYRKLMGMEVVESRFGDGLATMERKGRGHPLYGR
ncbi:GNAT family N-acetyltransferase, putative [Beauveria bassiana ARSEF 2860]|uniref:GNAT family N-acetyltransferase, putative n=1 Tax=Beauveria bassiana (strain ARSEF 2860) TaxID=655819 RepID=J4KQD3_BEAB2|nr:GNAT family N-acetyltransferase, putative [Beauveria bassiana ARSEF 2860]EJP69004.1 GNAT family N-acetyltransferase, putative [Beauveria bassiana ARSEF 2860]